LVVNKPSSTLSLNSNIGGIRTLSVTSGTLDLAGFLVTENSSTGGSLTLSANGTLKIGGTKTLPAFSLDYSLDAASTVEYNGAMQDISPVTYGNLVLSNSGPKLFSASTPTEATNLMVSVAATLPASATLRLTGNLTNNGTFNMSSSSQIEFNGIATQSIGGSSVTDLANVTISNTSFPGVSIESNQNLRGVMTLGSNASVDADGTSNTAVLRVVSLADAPTQDGAIAALPAGAAVIGNVTVQRYMAIEGPSGGRIYRYISSPVQNATVADMQNEIPVSGNFTGRSLCTGCTTSASLFSYDESVITGGIDGGYVAFPSLSNTETFQPGRGYAMFVRGNLLTTAMWDLRGPINSGLINVPVSFTSSGVLANDGWNLAGNPYPSTIDWNAASGWTRTNIDGTIYVRDNAAASGQYATWNGVVGTNGGSRYIPAGQAFWVKAGAASPVVSMNENVKAAGIQTSFFREASPENVLRITLSQGTVRDEAVIHFRPDATAGFDAQADALKLPNAGLNVSTQLPGKEKLAINSMDLSFCSRSVTIALDNIPKGTYNLSFDHGESFAATSTIMLVDNFTGTSVDVKLIDSYSFSVTDNPASIAATRFSLSFDQQPVSTDFSIITTTACHDSGGSIEISNTSEHVRYDITVNDFPVLSQAGNGSPLIAAVPAGILATGENIVRVTATPQNACGAPEMRSTTLIVEKANVPGVIIPASICRQGMATLSATGAATNEQYHWYSGADDITPDGFGATFETPLLSKSKTFYVSVATPSGCESVRVPVNAEVINFEDPVITLVDGALVVDYPGRKQWYFNGLPLDNDTTSSIRPEYAGTYSVTIAVKMCLAEARFAVDVPSNKIIAGEESGDPLTFGLYPNPVSDVVYFGPEPSTVIDVSVQNSSGQTVGKFVLERKTGMTFGKFDMSQLPAGMYFLDVRLADRAFRRKVIRK
jgi:hypothetical protein